MIPVSPLSFPFVSRVRRGVREVLHRSLLAGAFIGGIFVWPAHAHAAPAPAPAPASTSTSAKAKAKVTAPAAATTPAPAADSATTAPPTAGTGADAGPMAELKRANLQMKKLFGNRKPSWSPEGEAKNADIKKVVGGFLDFEELARRSLGRHWDGLTAKQRAEFVKTLRELVERNYVRQLYGQPDYDLRLEREEKNGNDATVFGTLHAVSKGKKVTIALEYKLIRKNNRWLVYDVVTDDLSLLENYRGEFNKVITKESFEALLARMKKKMAEK
jgi:phospholipid transport system substrate-binding protein